MKSEYDVIIVGSGAGGAAAAYRFVLAGWSVLVLEKGHPLPHDGSTLDDQRVVKRGEFLSKEPWVDGHGNAICPEEHFNVGGKTKWYGAAVLRYTPQDFEPEPAYSARGWPFGYEEFRAYYEEAEQLLGARDFDCEPNLQRILKRLSAKNDAWKAVPMTMALSAGILANRKEATHFDGFASAANLKGDAEINFLDRVAGNPNFELDVGSEVVALLPASTGTGRVAGVLLADGRKLHAPRVLLAAGALHSPRLLERYIDVNGARPPPQGLRLVGRNLKKHVLTALIAVSPSRKTDVLRKTMFVTNVDYPHSSVQPLGFDADLMAALVPKLVPRLLARFIGERAYGFFLQTEDGSSFDNHVSERAQPGTDGAPLRVMDYDAARTPASLQEHKAFTRAFQRDLARSGMLSFTQATGINGTAHAIGTLVAGNDPSDAVIDAQGAVHGIDGLYVVDGSALPRSSRVNPSLSIYAWGLRVADLLTREPKTRL